MNIVLRLVIEHLVKEHLEQLLNITSLPLPRNIIATILCYTLITFARKSLARSAVTSM
jgi:hypothetical protein